MEPRLRFFARTRPGKEGPTSAGSRETGSPEALRRAFDVTRLNPDRTAELLRSEGIATVHTRPGGSVLRIGAVEA